MCGHYRIRHHLGHQSIRTVVIQVALKHTEAHWYHPSKPPRHKVIQNLGAPSFAQNMRTGVCRKRPRGRSNVRHTIYPTRSAVRTCGPSLLLLGYLNSRDLPRVGRPSQHGVVCTQRFILSVVLQFARSCVFFGRVMCRLDLSDTVVTGQ